MSAVEETKDANETDVAVVEETKCCECENCQCGDNCECKEGECCTPQEEPADAVEEDVVVVVEEDDNPMLKDFAARVYDKLKEDFFKTYPDITRDSLFALVRIAMEEADKFKELKGTQKKELVLRVLHEAVKDHAYDDIGNEEVTFFVDKFADLLIDNLVDVDLGNLHINEQQKKKFRNFFKKLCPCINVD